MMIRGLRWPNPRAAWRPRRRFLHLAAGAAALPVMARFAWAQTYPTRPVRILVGFIPGGAFDITARLMGQWLSEQFHKPFVIENRLGAGTNIATEAAIRAPADGYTLLLGGATNAINATLYEKLGFNFIKDMAPVAAVIRFPNVLEVNPSFSANTVPELIANAKRNPGKINVGSSGKGTSQHLSGELFKIMTGIDMIHVPYRGAPQAISDLLSGHVQVSFEPLPASIEFIRSGKLRALGVTTATRSQTLPELPTVGEFVPGYEASAWNGLFAPKNTPIQIIEKLNTAINAGLADPVLRAKLIELGGMILGGSSADLGKLVADEIEKWGKVIRAANIKAD
jgi:tripartite-type tricarboxylate transporter receptor subunit TctC